MHTTQNGITYNVAGLDDGPRTFAYSAIFGRITEADDLNGNLATITDASGTTTYTWNEETNSPVSPARV